MAGIYIHIPFCKKICYYCDFYKSANYKYLDDFLNTLMLEIEQKSDFTKDEIKTIYFGGGTPSSIDLKHIKLIIDKLYSTYDIIKDVEITLEINPDDVDFEYFVNLRKLGFNRLSIGIQSFSDKILKFLNRRHDAKQSLQVIKDAQKAGFYNLSIDLIYGIPNQGLLDFTNDLDIFFELSIPHLSAYHLTIEEGTHFGRLAKKGLLDEVEEDISLVYYNELIERMKVKGYSHYEISNFAYKGFRSKHNMSYWEHISYVGLGPSAHSFDKKYRYWNISSLKEYINLINSNQIYYEKENLSLKDKYNEYIITSLRTSEGCKFDYVRKVFGEKLYWHTMHKLNEIHVGNYYIDKEGFSLTEENLITSDFFIKKFILEK